MKIFMVGGAVRDMLMGLEPKDKDYVVVDSSVEEMISHGYKQVGKGFPVFLDKNNVEYALARKEKSVGDGYNDFEFEWEGVTLEEDLFRRDLTINAISMEMMEDTDFFIEGEEGKYRVYDPYGGKDDIQNKIFRPVSKHFMEDPVRVLRVARLRARYGAEWKLSKELIEMCSTMSKKGKMNSLDKNRIWKELSRALMEPNPRLFFDTLLELDCLHTVFPDIYKLLTALESRRWHPEGTAYEHTMLVLTQAAMMNFSLEVRFACLVHDIGKGLTPFDKLPKHYGHDVNGADFLGTFCDKYAVPNKIFDLSKYATLYHMRCHNLFELKPLTIVKMFEKCRGNEEYVDVLVKVGICDERGRLGSENNSYDHVVILYDFLKAYKKVKYSNIFDEDEKPSVDRIKSSMQKERVFEVKKVLDESKKT